VTDLSIFFDKMGATVLQMLVDRVLDREGAEKKNEIQSFTFNRNFSAKR
jgi:hypothetical protein